MTGIVDSSITDAVAAFIRENFLYARPDYQLRNDAQLVEDGIMDSMGAVEVVAFLEKQFGISISDDEITEDNFGTIAVIAEFVGRKRRGAA